MDQYAASNERVITSCVKTYIKESGAGNFPNLSSVSALAIVKDAKGKPHFPDLPQLHFSLAHSKDYVACAFAGQNIGLDLQAHVKCDQQAIARRYYHKEEFDYLEKTSYRQFFSTWAAKESYAKYTGGGLAGQMDSFSVLGPYGLRKKLDQAELWHHDAINGYSMCLCAHTIRRVKIVDLRNK